VPLGAGAADVGATDFGSTSEPDTLMVLSPPVGFALVESVTSATVNDPPSTPDDNAGQFNDIATESTRWHAQNLFESLVFTSRYMNRLAAETHQNRRL